MGREPVIVVRDGEVKVLISRCAQPMVCAEGRGNVERFVCPYHGWSYDRAGVLRAVPFSSGYDKPALPQVKSAPRVALYRGFIFASLAESGPSLEEFLGPAKASFDDFVDRAPGGELEVAGGVFKHAYNGNWKLMLENHLDGAHRLGTAPHRWRWRAAHRSPESRGRALLRHRGSPDAPERRAGCGVGSGRHLDHAVWTRLHGRLPRRFATGSRNG